MPDKKKVLPECPVCWTNKFVVITYGVGTCRAVCSVDEGGCGSGAWSVIAGDEAGAIRPWTEAANKRAKLLALVWSDQDNARRCELIDKEAEYCSSEKELVELETLQTRMLAYRRIVAPLPKGETS